MAQVTEEVRYQKDKITKRLNRVLESNNLPRMIQKVDLLAKQSKGQKGHKDLTNRLEVTHKYLVKMMGFAEKAKESMIEAEGYAKELEN